MQKPQRTQRKSAEGTEKNSSFTSAYTSAPSAVSALFSGKANPLFTPIALGYAVFGVLLLFSILFYLERACYADIAFQTFTIINTESVAYQLDRFGALFIQLFPLAAVLLKLPLQHVLLSYSIALVLQNIFFYWLLHRVLKQKEVALVLMLFNILMVSETFYWTTNEIKQGFSFSILFAGIIRALPVENYAGWRKAALLFLYLVLLVVAVFLHPLVVVAIAFVVGYHALHCGKYFSQTTLWSYGMVAGIVLTKYLFLPVASYDAEQLSLRDNFILYFPHYYELASFKRFAGYLIKDWYLYGLMVAVVIIYYLWRKDWRRLAWQLAFTAGYFLIVVVTHPDSEKLFIECYYQALAIFILFPFVMEVLPTVKIQHVVLLLIVLCVLRLNFIYHVHHKYTDRLSLVQQVLNSHEGKFVIPLEKYPHQDQMMTWGIPYESAILSAMQSPDSCRSFAVLRDTTVVGNDAALFHTVFGNISYDDLNPDYFRPARGEYRVNSLNR